MERLLGRTFWTFAFGCLVALPPFVAAMEAAFPDLGGWLPDALFVLSWLPLVFGAVLFLIYWKPVWRRAWCLPGAGSWLRANVFPDLNGEWQITTTSNWPRVEALAKAAAGAVAPVGPPPAFAVFDKLTATIDQDWTGLRMTIRRPVATKDGYLLDRSESISFDLIRPTSDESCPRIAYFYRQDNRPEEMTTNDRQFLGAAMLRVLDDDTMEGDYMTNQAWEKGLNVAGKVRMTRIKPHVPVPAKLAGG